ncbi:MAG: tetratricopeptide repeat protein [Planctomycetaceae bacterium]|nr:tetratricopeptide repeat protein [Planctomycetaceae bacterium]MBT6484747.1 tetratricopeptide repeat protein [Planctomycetaceae bacterium]
MSMVRHLLFLLFVVMPLLLWGSKRAVAQENDPFETARTHLQHGRYEEALETYDELAEVKEHAVSVALGKARVFQAQGELAKAAEQLASARTADARSTQATARLAEIRFLQGNYTDAEKLAEAALKLDGRNPLARIVLADVQTETGRLKEAGENYRWFVRFYNQAQPEDAETLLLVARGTLQYARWRSISQIFSFVLNTLCPDALKADKLSWQAYHVSGDLLLEKYNRAQAIPEFKQALAINPQAVPVLVSLGEAALQQYDLKGAEEFAERALNANPHSVPALNLKADLSIANGKLSDALKTVEESLKINPHEQRTLARQAAIFLLLDGEPPELDDLLANLEKIDRVKIKKPSRFSKLIVDLAKRNSHPGYFLTILGSTLERRRQYPIAQKLFQRAVDVMPQLSEPKTSLGMLFMRVGKTEEAQKILDSAFKADPYHVRVSNMRKVLKLLGGYETIATDHFIIRVDSKLDKVLGEYMAEYLEENYAELVEQFGFEPPARTHFEIYNNAKGLSAHQWFSARMIGLPWIQTIGASTGVIVALASPTAAGEPFNWARVVKHEFVHVITLQQTKFHIPHWFTEALAVTSEGYPRPATWDKLLLERVPKGELRSLDELNDAFIRPKTPLDWQFAYCQSRLYAQYMIEKYGKETIPKMLAEYRKNTPTKKAIPLVFGVDVETFEKGYREFLNTIVAELKQGAPTETKQTPAELEKAYNADPDNPTAAAKYAFVLLRLRQAEQARELALKALEKNEKEPLAALVMAQLELRGEDSAAAIEYLEKGLDSKQPHALLLSSLARLKLATEKHAEAAELYELGLEKFPHDIDWLKGATAAYLKLDETDKLTAALKELARRDPDDATVRKKLAEMALDNGDFKEAAKYGRLAIHVDVLDAEVHRILGESYRGLKNYPRSIKEFEVAMGLKPKDDTLEVGLAKTHLAAGAKEKARLLLDAVLERNPENTAAKTLQEKLD